MKLSTEHRVLLAVFVALFVDIASFSMILPVFPAILDYYANQPKEADWFFSTLNTTVTEFREAIGAPGLQRWNSVLFGGALGSLFCLLQFISSPLIGALSDLYGRKRILLVAAFGVTVSCAIWAVASSFLQFVVARIICGLSKGSSSIYSAIVTDVCGSESRNVGMVVVGLSYALGFIAGPMCGAWLSAYMRDHMESERFFLLPALVALALSLFDMLIIAIWLPETNCRTNSSLKVENSQQKLQDSAGNGLEQQKHSQPPRSLTVGERLIDSFRLIEPLSLFRFDAVRDANPETRSALRNFGFTYFLYMVLFSGIEFNLTFLTTTRFAYNSMQQGKMFVFIGVLMLVFQGGIVRRVRAGNEQRAATFGMLLVIPSGLILAFLDSHVCFYLALTSYTYASAAVVPCMTTCVSRFGGAYEKGKLLGILRSLGALARAIGPLLFASIFWLYGAEMAYAVAGVAMLIPVAIICSIPKSASSDTLKKSD